MRPDARVWRKQQRAVLKGVARGRRDTHKVETQEPTPGSSWGRRHSREWLRRWLGGA